MGFHERLAKAWAPSGSMLCVGLDPDPARVPEPLDGAPDAIERFCTAIVDATADLVCAFKPQFAHFAVAARRAGARGACAATSARRYPDVVLVLDAKRGDIGSTAEHYAREAFGRYARRRRDGEPVPRHRRRGAVPRRGGGVLALCHTSNPGSAELQDLDVGGAAAVRAGRRRWSPRAWSQLGEAGLVVGATYPDAARPRSARSSATCRSCVPGIGTQGGDLAASVAGRARRPAAPACCSARRAAILYAVRAATTSPTPPAPSRSRRATRSTPPPAG